MTVGSYFKCLPWAAFILSVVLYNLYLEPDSLMWRVLSGISVISFLLYPVSKMAIERFALVYTKREFWSRGIFMETPAKNPVYVLYYLFCFIMAIPAGLIFLIIFLFMKKASK